MASWVSCLTSRKPNSLGFVLFSPPSAFLLRTLFSFLRTATNARPPVGLACTTCTGISSRTRLLWRLTIIYDGPYSTMTHRSSSWRIAFCHTYDSRPFTVRWCRDLPVGYKEALLRGMSSECSLFIVLQSDPSSPLISILYFLPKDQTLKQVTKQRKGSPYVAEHFSHDQTMLSSYDLASSPRIAQAPHRVLLSDDPVVL